MASPASNKGTIYKVSTSTSSSVEVTGAGARFPQVIRTTAITIATTGASVPSTAHGMISATRSKLNEQNELHQKLDKLQSEFPVLRQNYEGLKARFHVLEKVNTRLQADKDRLTSELGLMTSKADALSLVNADLLKQLQAMRQPKAESRSGPGVSTLPLSPLAGTKLARKNFPILDPIAPPVKRLPRVSNINTSTPPSTEAPTSPQEILK